MREVSLLFWMLACSSPEPTPPLVMPPPAPRPSLVLLTTDTTRADRIGAYGHAAARTPNLDALAARGARFERAWATVPLTTPAHSSIMSGLYPPRHGVHTNGDAILPDGVTTLAEVLKEQGWRTAASVSAFVTTRVWNLDQGFDAYFDDVVPSGPHGSRWRRERPAGPVIDDAVAWLAEQDGSAPFFLWVHLYDPHRPFEAPEPWASELADPYDAEIAYMDHEIGRLVTAAEQAASGGLAWIALADHGEALAGEHGEQSHGMFLFEPTVRVPFIVVPPGEPHPVVVGDVAASAVDVVPTALGLLGLQPPDGLDGVDLGPALRGEPMDRGPVFLEARSAEQRFGFAPELAAVLGSLKLMNTPHPRLYDVDADPGEAHDLVDLRAEQVDALRRFVERVDAFEAGPVEAPAPEALSQLAALGYVGAGFTTEAPEGGPVDAKDQLDVIGALDRARELGRDPERAAEAEAIYRQILALNPWLQEAITGLARTVARQGRHDEAEALCSAALARNDASTLLLLTRSSARGAQGDFAGALADIDAALAMVPGDGLARVARLRTMAAAGDAAGAVALGESWLADTPDDADLHAVVGQLLWHDGQRAEARPHLSDSMADGLPRQEVITLLARGALADEKWPEAERLLKLEQRLGPVPPNQHKLLGDAHMMQSEWDDASAEYRFAAEAGDLDARRAWAQATFNTGDYALAAQILAPVVDATPDDPGVLLLQANVLSKQGRVEEARAMFDRAKKLSTRSYSTVP